MRLMGGTVLYDELGIFPRIKGLERRLSRGRVTAFWRQMLQILAKALEVDIAIDEEHHLFRTIVTTYKAEGIVSGIGAQLLRIAKDVMAEGMTFEQQVFEFIIDQFSLSISCCGNWLWNTMSVSTLTAWEKCSLEMAA